MRGDDLRDRFHEALTASCGVRPGTRLLVACSGGLDSTVLLDLLVRCRDELDLVLCAATVDHGMRPGAAREGELVCRSCEDAGVPWSALAIQIGEPLRRRMGLEAAARQCRYEALDREAARVEARAIVLAHHRDDQAETVLMRALVGTGIRGLAAMRPRAGNRLRPLLGVPRSAIEAYARSRGLRWREDPSNLDPRHLRNRVRNQLMPLVTELVGESSVDHLADLADRCAADDRCLSALAQRAAGLAPGGPSEVPLAELDALDPAIQVRIVQALVQRVDPSCRPGQVHLDAALALLDGPPRTAGVDLPGGLRIERADGHLRALRPVTPGPAAEPAQLEIPGRHRWAGTGHLFVAEVHDDVARVGVGADAGRWRVWFDLDRLTTPLRVHTLERGHRMRLFGGPGRRKVSDLLAEAKIPRGLRVNWPIIADAERVIWVPGCRSSDAARVDSGTARILELKVEDDP